jgi:hypothetical protein
MIHAGTIAGKNRGKPIGPSGRHARNSAGKKKQFRREKKAGIGIGERELYIVDKQLSIIRTKKRKKSTTSKFGKLFFSLLIVFPSFPSSRLGTHSGEALLRKASDN